MNEIKPSPDSRNHYDKYGEKLEQEIKKDLDIALDELDTHKKMCEEYSEKADYLKKLLAGVGAADGRPREEPMPSFRPETDIN